MRYLNWVDISLSFKVIGCRHQAFKVPITPPTSVVMGHSLNSWDTSHCLEILKNHTTNQGSPFSPTIVVEIDDIKARNSKRTDSKFKKTYLRQIHPLSSEYRKLQADSLLDALLKDGKIRMTTA
ncbi:12499_t:CDS:2 [Funneliformis mosseae]|uniref:12499_t:CDS:1 n=1 Tax=Funneliformis mosseae TaxID=27381 RepID=A0A9N9A5J2_FUNMO|nr:12499_t:CDS:2 [Funneliformis mosseae]